MSHSTCVLRTHTHMHTRTHTHAHTHTHTSFSTVLGLVSLPPSVRAITTAGSRKKGLRPYQEGRREEEMKGEERRKTEGGKREKRDR